MAHPAVNQTNWRLIALAFAAAIVIPGALPSRAADAPESAQPLRGPVIQKQAPVDDAHLKKVSSKRVKTDIFIAYRMARAPWLDKAVAADPSLAEAICAFPGPAKVLARHHRIADIAEADHYLCRRLTRWSGATYALLANAHADRVIQLDPEGIYRAINRDPKVARVLAKHMMFNQMIVETPDLGRVVAEHI